MKLSRIDLIPLLICFVLFFGCATTKTEPKGTEIPFSKSLATHPEDVRALLYVNPDAPKKNYSKLFIAPVQIYQGDDNGFGTLPKEDKQMMADFISKEMNRIIGERYEIVETPGHDTLHIQLILVGLEKTNTVMRSLTYGNPMGMSMNLAKGLAGKEGVYLGSVTLAGEFIDSETGIVRSAFMGKIYPFALDVSFSPWDAAKYGITKFVKDLRNTLDKNSKR